MNYETMSRDQLFSSIGAISFAMDDLRLFLDTHPDCSEALSCYVEYMKQRHEMVAAYTRRFGPLDAYYTDAENGSWCWNAGPMPWKGEAN